MVTRLVHEELDGRHRRVPEDDEVGQCGPHIKNELAPAHEDLADTSQRGLRQRSVGRRFEEFGVPTETSHAWCRERFRS